MNKHKKIPLKIPLLLYLLSLSLALILTGCGKKDKNAEDYQGKEETTLNSIQIGDSSYQKKQNVETYLIVGVDSVGPVEKKEAYDGTGQSDFIELLVVDQAADTYQMLTINRDTICSVGCYTDDLEYTGEQDIQLAYAHAQGDGLEMSCENTVKAVESLLYGIEIDHYVVLQKDAIKIVNNQLGGVTVTIEDDFSKEDESLVMGESIHLSDEQAYAYCCGRMSVGDGENTGRIKRQQTYMEAAKPVLKEKCKENESFANTAFDALKEYMVTDITGKEISRLAKAMLKDEDLGTVTFEGEEGEDDLGFHTFTIKEESQQSIVRELFTQQ